jgi:hypothetical protein
MMSDTGMTAAEREERDRMLRRINRLEHDLERLDVDLQDAVARADWAEKNLDVLASHVGDALGLLQRLADRADVQDAAIAGVAGEIRSARAAREGQSVAVPIPTSSPNSRLAAERELVPQRLSPVA